MPSAALLAANVFLLMLLVLICGNVAMLLFARAATREAEILVRFALGATRGQIVMQFFAEALVLGALGAVAGLAAVRLGLQWFMEVSAAEAGGRLPFWLDAGLSPATLLYAGALTVLVAVIAGVVPALLATRSGVESRLRQVSAGGGGLRFGRMWTWVLVTQVAVTVAFPAAAFFAKRYVVGIQSLDVGFAAEEYLSARIEMDPDAGAGASADTSARFLARFAGSARALERRLATEPGVVAVTFTDHLPRTFHPRHVVEVEGVAAAAAQTGDRRTVSRASVAANYFGALEAPVLAGRGFRAGAPGSGAGGVVVNRSFVAQELGGHSPLGRRVRYLDPDDPARKPGPWHEIVGVVKDLGMVADDPAEGAGLYHPLAPGADYPVYLALRVRGDPESFVPRLRSLAAAVDPRLRLHEVLPLDEAGATLWLETAFLFDLLLLVSSVAVVLSLAGIYSVMSFTVSRRTREIGIRVALGAHRGRIVATIFARPLAQVGLGVAVGGGLTAALTLAVSGGEVSARGAALVMAHMALMVGVCMLAWIVPTRRALRIEPTEALRTDP
jgi:predicted permease